MRTLAGVLALVAALAGVGTAQDDQAKKVDQQKKAAQAAWESLDTGEMAFVETKHLLICAPKAMQGRIKSVGVLLEKYHDQAIKATGQDPKEAYPGKITVYLLPGKELLTAFARRVEKRRPMSGETGTYKASDDRLHAAAIPKEGKPPISVEARAGEMLAAVILQRKAGRTTALPDWLIAGFGRATSYQVYPKTEKFVLEERKQTRILVRKRDASAIWGGSLESEEADPLQASLSEFMAYGPARKYFGKFVVGFQPGENMATKTTAQALEQAGLTTDKVSRAWKNWVK
jgi:hypothetical protein